MYEWLWIGLGGALGAIGRYVVSFLTQEALMTSFPYGTLVVNVLGSFILGGLHNLLGPANSEMRLLFIVGFLGSFTTFSTFSLNVAQLLETGDILSVFLYILWSVSLSIGGLFLGLWVTSFQ